MKHTQAKRKGLRLGERNDLVSLSRSAAYKSCRSSDSIAVSAAFRRKSRLSLALWNSNFASRRFFWVALFGSDFIPNEPRANFYFSAKEVLFLREVVLDCRAIQCATNCKV